MADMIRPTRPGPLWYSHPLPMPHPHPAVLYHINIMVGLAGILQHRTRGWVEDVQASNVVVSTCAPQPATAKPITGYLLYQLGTLRPWHHKPNVIT